MAGKSKSYRAGPAFAEHHSNRGEEPPRSVGGGVKTEGTHMSGIDDGAKTKKTKQHRSKSGKMPTRPSSYLGNN